MTIDLTSLKYNEAGLIPCIAQSQETGEVLMLAWMNEEALRLTLTTGRVTYYSRSRGKLWVKGEGSGNTQRLIEMRLDCDQDCLLAIIEQKGPACHTGKRSCFFTEIGNTSIKEDMKEVEDERSV